MKFLVPAQSARRGADAIVRGCIELGMLVGPGDVALPTFDSTVRMRAARKARADRVSDADDAIAFAERLTLICSQALGRDLASMILHGSLVPLPGRMPQRGGSLSTG